MFNQFRVISSFFCFFSDSRIHGIQVVFLACSDRFKKCFTLLYERDVISVDVSWNVAQDMCKVYNGTLLNLHSNLEMDFVSEKLLRFSHDINNDFVYIGLYFL